MRRGRGYIRVYPIAFARYVENTLDWLDAKVVTGEGVGLCYVLRT